MCTVHGEEHLNGNSVIMLVINLSQLHFSCIYLKLCIYAYMLHIFYIYSAYILHICCIYSAYILDIFEWYFCYSACNKLKAPAFQMHIFEIMHTCCIYFAYILHTFCIYLHIFCRYLKLCINVSNTCEHEECINNYHSFSLLFTHNINFISSFVAKVVAICSQCCYCHWCLWQSVLTRN